MLEVTRWCSSSSSVNGYEGPGSHGTRIRLMHYSHRFWLQQVTREMHGGSGANADNGSSEHGCDSDHSVAGDEGRQQ